MNNPVFEIIFEGQDAETKLMTFFDDDNETYSVIRESAARMLGGLCRIRTPWNLGEWGPVTHSIPLTFVVDSVEFRDDFFVVSDLQTDVQIGSSTCRKWGIRVTEDGSVSL